ncbi:MAG: DUF5107 domain-containing protein [Maribacter sp.]|nr:DUF5107 domain-containing protein [Maribacter sp.]
MKLNSPIFFAIFYSMLAFGQKATITEETLNMKTYMYSEPDPVPNISRIYPYFRFDNYEAKGVNRDWKMVVLENPYLKVYVCPSVGGKIWGAIEKSTGKEFLYFNEVVKFRDVAMRGAWTSGGLEYNFGDIGHIPTCATPVDYVIKENQDGSVSCIVGAIDLPSRTKWNVEISLQKDKAFFETKVSWFNASSIPVTYYHWMNAAAKADGDLEFIYPGNKRIGHGGELGDWPIDANRDISKYENNNFGIYKSYHVLNSYSNFFGGYWHDDDFGFGHYASYDDKPGKKIWIWGLSDQGMIWEDLLTDSNGQYIEYQAGKLFNQAANSSTLTPFKHREFMPYDSDIMNEIWFPIKETKGMVAASEYGVLNVDREENHIELRLSPLQPLSHNIVVKVDEKEIFRKKMDVGTLELFTEIIPLDKDKDFIVELGSKLLIYNSKEESNNVDRPLITNEDFDWSSAYGLYINGLELEKQRRYTDAKNTYLKSYKKDPDFIPTLNRLALAYFKLNDQSEALIYSIKALAIDTYDGFGNYLYGLINARLGETNEAKSGFSIACQDVAFRSASYTELAALFLREDDLKQAFAYAEKALQFNVFNIRAFEIQAIIHRKEKRRIEALKTITKLDELDATSDFKNFESYLWGTMDKASLNQQISNELPFESYLELASKYLEYGSEDNALQILELAPKNVVVMLWKAYFDKGNESTLLKEALEVEPEMVFPHRQETGKILKYFIEKDRDWKLRYFLGLQQWSIGNLDEAKKLFKQCETVPNTVPFYLAKIKLFDFETEITLNALKKADKIDSENWRLKLAWMQYFERTGQFESAKDLAKETFKKYPKKAVIGMLYAKMLIKLKEYKTALDFLEKFEVLPFEGATEGRNIYHETCIKLSLDAIAKKRYSDAIKYAQKAKLWPKNLGVGQHYDVDERLDDYLMGYAYEKLGNKERSALFYNKIIGHSTPEYLNESSKLYIQLAIAEKLNNEKLVQHLEDKYTSKSTNNKYIEWAIAKFKNNNADKLGNDILNSKTEIQVYDIQFVDAEFKLVMDVINRVK